MLGIRQIIVKSYFGKSNNILIFNIKVNHSLKCFFYVYDVRTTFLLYYRPHRINYSNA